MSAQNITPATLKELEKTIAKEGKAEDSMVKHALKDLATMEKARAKAEKAKVKAENAVHKAEKKELSTAKAVNKATHSHDVAVAGLNNAKSEAHLKLRQDLKLQQELEEQKIHTDTTIKTHQAHVEEREAKLSEIQSELATDAN